MNRRQLETVIEQKHRRQAIASGWFVEKILSCARNGFPDRFYAKDRRVVLIEWKRVGEKLTPQQRLRHAELKKAGVEVYVVDNVLDANRILGIEY
jgi:VRR-NUC domain